MKNIKLVIYNTIIILVFSVVSIVLDLVQCDYFVQIVFSLAFLSVLLLSLNIFILRKIKKENLLESRSGYVEDVADDTNEPDMITEEEEENHCMKLVEAIDKKLNYSEIINLKFQKLSDAIQLVGAVAYQLKEKELHLVGTYALLEDDYEKLISIEKGMTGQVAKNALPIVIDLKTKIDYFVVSGLGESKPNFLYILPVLDKENTIGVVELATFKKLTDRRVNFLIEAFRK